jgi:hypothetical protein
MFGLPMHLSGLMAMVMDLATTLVELMVINVLEYQEPRQQTGMVVLIQMVMDTLMLTEAGPLVMEQTHILQTQQSGLTLMVMVFLTKEEKMTVQTLLAHQFTIEKDALIPMAMDIPMLIRVGHLLMVLMYSIRTQLNGVMLILMGTEMNPQEI